MHTLNVLLTKHKLIEKDDEICGSTKLVGHDFCSVQDPSETTIKKKGHGERITDWRAHFNSCEWS